MKTKTDFYLEESRLKRLAMEELTEAVKSLPSQSCVWIDKVNKYDFDPAEIPQVIAYSKWSDDLASYHVCSVEWSANGGANGGGANSGGANSGGLTIRGYAREFGRYEDSVRIDADQFVSALEIAEIIEKIPEVN